MLRAGPPRSRECRSCKLGVEAKDSYTPALGDERSADVVPDGGGKGASTRAWFVAELERTARREQARGKGWLLLGGWASCGRDENEPTRSGATVRCFVQALDRKRPPSKRQTLPDATSSLYVSRRAARSRCETPTSIFVYTLCVLLQTRPRARGRGRTPSRA